MSSTPAQYHPTPARGRFKPEQYTSPDWFAEEKLDGDRRIGQFIAEGVRFTGRRVSDVTGLLVEKTENLPHLNPAVPGLVGTVLDGEMLVPGQRSKAVTSIMGSAPEVAIAKQRERGWLQWHVFDCLAYRGEDLREQPLWVRRQYLARALAEWGNPHAHEVRPVVEGREEFLLRVWETGGEGLILKDWRSTYSQEKAWVKVKREDTEDVVITGFDPPKTESEKVDGSVSVTKYAARGWIGAVRFGQYREGALVDCGACSGMTDELRQAFSERPAEYVGRVIEILANEREPTGKFRHPRFVAFRDDKNASDCVWR